MYLLLNSINYWLLFNLNILLLFGLNTWLLFNLNTRLLFGPNTWTLYGLSTWLLFSLNSSLHFSLNAWFQFSLNTLLLFSPNILPLFSSNTLFLFSPVLTIYFWRVWTWFRLTPLNGIVSVVFNLIFWYFFWCKLNIDSGRVLPLSAQFALQTIFYQIMHTLVHERLNVTGGEPFTCYRSVLCASISSICGLVHSRTRENMNGSGTKQHL